MDVGGATDWSMDKVLSRAAILKLLSQHYGPIEPVLEKSSAPAQRFALPDGTTFGIIASTTTPFCATCDRSRLTADGMWFLCLYATEGTDLGQLLRAGASREEIKARILAGWQARRDRGAEQRKALEWVGIRARLVGLGVSVGLTLWRERLHMHPHEHAEEAAHVHVHSHRDGPHHAHLHRFRLEYKSLAVGMVHGLAGSAALLLLVLAAARSVLDGLLYIMAFGAGSIAAMVLLGVMLSLPFVFTPVHLVRTNLALRALAGLVSVSLGGLILYESVVL